MKAKKSVLSVGLAMVLLLATRVSYTEGDQARRVLEGEIRHDQYGQLNPIEEVQDISAHQVRTVNSYAELKAEMERNLEARNTQFRIDYKGSLSNVIGTISSAYEDIMKGNHYLSGHMSRIQFNTSSLGDDHRIEFTASYLSTRDQEAFVDLEVERIANQIIRAGMTDFQKVKAINDYIVLNTEYSTSLGAGVSQHSAYAVLKEGKGVCSGYALAALRLMERAGVEAQYITGRAGDENHGWNLVRVDGQWYHLDTTWNDPTPNRPGVVSYEYFLVPDNYISTTHSWVRGDFPSAVSNRYSWMNEIGSANISGSRIFYSSRSDDYRMYSINEDGTDRRRLTDGRAPYLALVGNKIYFTDYNRGGYIYKMNTDGTNVELVRETYAKDLYLDGSNLYFTNVATGVKQSMDVSRDISDKPSDRPSLDGVSAWAEPEVRGAVENGLAVDRLLSNFQRNITREEFAELSVKLYEALSGQTALPVSPNPFSDTGNIEVLKANNLGIIYGVGGGRFAPNNNITREEIAVMFYRTIEAVDPSLVRGNFTPTFADSNQISTWARREVAFMNSRGLLQGVGANRVNPKGNATREQAMILSYRTFNTYN